MNKTNNLKIESEKFQIFNVKSRYIKIKWEFKVNKSKDYFK